MPVAARPSGSTRIASYVSRTSREQRHEGESGKRTTELLQQDPFSIPSSTEKQER